jgi:hypothetical protein
MLGRPEGRWAGWKVAPDGSLSLAAFKSGVDMNARAGCDCGESNTVMTSLATFSTDLMPRFMRPFQSRALSSFPNQIPGRICIGPSIYGTVGEPSPSSSLRRKSDEVLALGKERTDGLRRAWTAGPSSGSLGCSEVMGLKSEADDDCADGSESESRFLFMLRDCGRLGGGKMKESVSEVAEETVEEDPASTRGTSSCWDGVWMVRRGTGAFLRCACVGNALWGRGVAVSMVY